MEAVTQTMKEGSCLGLIVIRVVTAVEITRVIIQEVIKIHWGLEAVTPTEIHTVWAMEVEQEPTVALPRALVINEEALKTEMVEITNLHLRLQVVITITVEEQTMLAEMETIMAMRTFRDRHRMIRPSHSQMLLAQTRQIPASKQLKLQRTTIIGTISTSGVATVTMQIAVLVRTSHTTAARKIIEITVEVVVVAARASLQAKSVTRRFCRTLRATRPTMQAQRSTILPR